MDWFVTSKQTIGFLFNGTYNNMDGDFTSDAAIMRTGTSKIDSTERSESRFTQKYSSQVYNLNYRLTGDEGEELTVDADYGHMYGKNWQDIQSRYFNADGSEHRLPTEFQYSGPRTIDILSLKADYVKPLSDKSSIEVGAKTGKTTTENDILYENLYGGQWEVDPNQTNSFNYAEHVSAAYATYSHKFGKFSAMAGLRTEYTSIKGESPTTNTTFRRDYWDWFPSAYLQYQIDERQGLNLSYSRKINRPGYSLLNPFREYIDPFTYSSGNPDLNPSYPNTLALRYNIGGYTINASYSQEKDVFERVYIQDDANQITNITSRNIGKRNLLTLSAFAAISLTQWYALSMYAEARYAMVDGLYNGSLLETNYLEGNIFLQHVFTIQPTLRAILQMMWISPSRQGSIAKFDNMWTMNAQVEKSFLDKRLSLVLSCNDIFSSMVYKGNINFGNINQDFKEDHHQSQLLLTVKYSFGSQQIRSTRKRNVGIEEEIGRTK